MHCSHTLFFTLARYNLGRPAGPVHPAPRIQSPEQEGTQLHRELHARAHTHTHIQTCKIFFLFSTNTVLARDPNHNLTPHSKPNPKCGSKNHVQSRVRCAASVELSRQLTSPRTTRSLSLRSELIGSSLTHEGHADTL